MKMATRTALVTGAGNGLGRAISIALAASGSAVVLVARDRSRLDATATVIRDAGGSAIVATCDVRDAASVMELEGELAAHEVSILINNAGVAGPVAPLDEIEVDEWDDVFAANVRSVFLMCKAFGPAMRDRGTGDIINIGSVAGSRPLPRRSPYCASKAALCALSDVLAHELGPAGVRVNTLAPGPVAGERMTRNFNAESERLGITVAEAEAQYVGRSASQRMVTEGEVAEAVVAMLSMTGLNGSLVDLSAGMIGR